MRHLQKKCKHYVNTTNAHAAQLIITMSCKMINYFNTYYRKKINVVGGTFVQLFQTEICITLFAK